MPKHIDTVSTITAPSRPERTIVEDLDRVVITRRPGRRFIVRAQVGGMDLATGDLISPEVMRVDHGTRPISGTLDPSDTARMGELVSYQGIDGVYRAIRRGDIIRILAGLLFEERGRQLAAEQAAAEQAAAEQAAARDTEPQTEE